MAEDIKKVKLLFRRGTQSELADLDTGEPGLATDTGNLYVGTGNGNKSQLAKQDQVNTIQTDVTNTKQTVTGLSTDNSKNKSDISQLKTDTSGLRNDVNALTEDVSELGVSVNTNATDINTLKGTKAEVEAARGLEASLKARLEGMEKADNKQSWKVTAATQTRFTLSNGSYTVGSKSFSVYLEGVLQPEDAYVQVDSKNFDMVDPVPKDLTVTAVWREGKAPIQFGHNTTHYVGGQDPLDITKLTNYQAEVADKVASLQSTLDNQAFSVSLAKHLTIKNNVFEDALESAIAELPSSGGEITFPLGYQFNMKRTVTITKNNVILKPLSIYYANNIYTSTPNLTMFKILAYGFRALNLNIIGDGADEYGTGATTIPFEVGDGVNQNLDNFTLMDCSFTRCKKIDIKTRNFIIQDNLFSWMDTCLEINGVTSSTQTDRRDYFIQHNRFHVSNVGINFAGNVAHSEVHCADNIIDRNNYGIIGCFDDSDIIDNQIVLCKNDGIMAYAANKSILHVGNNIKGNTITGWAGTGLNDGYGIYSEVQKSSINGNSIKKKGKDGIYVKAAYTQIHDNYIRGCDFKSQNLYSGLRVGGSYCSLAGNVSVKTDEACTQQYGLFIESTCQGTQLGQNMLSGLVGQMNVPPSSTIGFTGEGLSRAVSNGAALPSDTEGQRGDLRINKIPTEQGVAGSRYISWWQKIQDYNGAVTWVELRIPTGR